ncbi:uncharacterized protein BCR38DRAFT_412704 [Pseudomassariella vexata]|uniref:Uncharacterized protein n=1 Tax=Pseudomassariella vexata TaxID=1141098 RepID=A0A1Y2DKJ9_9PEZI|nr:uncharacterized protein BCR38DRAFT_412704 [Pseudomassariella vexata]ORY59709.1 hypothetical protein BCR38DRAFT_412704 [Pseudomassariella vexata]
MGQTTFLQAAAMATLSLRVVASAILNTTAVPLANRCSSYPRYDILTNVAGPWLVIADSSGHTVDGTKASVAMFRDTIDLHPYGFITIPGGNSTFPSTNITLPGDISMRCAHNILQAQVNLEPDRGVKWQDLLIAGNPNWQESIGFAFPGASYPGIAIEPYEHYVDDVKQPGVFLGGQNSTTWQFKYNWAGVMGDYYLLRLLGPNHDHYPPAEEDFTGFLKIVT